MRVLHLPVNIASQMSVLVSALRDLGIDARGISFESSVLNDQRGIEVIDFSKVPNKFRRKAMQAAAQGAVLRAIAAADVVHWHFHGSTTRFDLDLRLAAALAKARLVQFHGTDIRIPEIASRDNPYLRRLMADQPNSYPISLGQSRATQQKFARHGFACLLTGPELELYRQPDIFASQFKTDVALDTSQYLPSLPDPRTPAPLIVHLPSNSAIKGTSHVLEAIERVKERREIRFQLVRNVEHSEAMRMVRSSDMVLDQFCLGSFGLAAVEGMALGKPTLCYLTPAVAARLAGKSPLLNVSPERLSSTIIELIDDGERRRELGMAGRHYVENVHEAKVVASRLVEDVYEPLLAKAKG